MEEVRHEREAGGVLGTDRREVLDLARRRQRQRGVDEVHGSVLSREPVHHLLCLFHRADDLWRRRLLGVERIGRLGADRRAAVVQEAHDLEAHPRVVAEGAGEPLPRLAGARDEHAADVGALLAGPPQRGVNPQPERHEEARGDHAEEEHVQPRERELAVEEQRPERDEEAEPHRPRDGPDDEREPLRAPRLVQPRDQERPAPQRQHERQELEVIADRHPLRRGQNLEPDDVRETPRHRDQGEVGGEEGALEEKAALAEHEDGSGRGGDPGEQDSRPAATSASGAGTLCGSGSLARGRKQKRDGAR